MLVSQTGDVLELLSRPRASVLVGVHNALGAKIAEESGADGLWISSFEVHAAARLPDADILGTQDYVDVISKIVDRVGIPVLVDGNAGGGNAINIRKRQLEPRTGVHLRAVGSHLQHGGGDGPHRHHRSTARSQQR
jgi:2-methylisocitrate lyase-like PEP mutase family enzyme